MANEDDNFKRTFKYYKSRKNSPDLSNVLDFDGDKTLPEGVRCVTLPPPALPILEGLEPVNTWKVYTVDSIPGFYFIRNPFKAGYQQYWIKRCLHDFPNKPNVCNLDAHLSLDESCHLWQHSLREKERQRSRKCPEKTLIDKLRWTTLGYHHNWDTKEYTLTHHTPFPVDLAYFSRFVVESLGFPPPYRAEAAIVNYYHQDSTLAGHTDHSEFDEEAPLVSVSFGETAIFLLGGTTKDTTPTAMFLRSGDISVMSGKCRLAYHAVPRILPSASKHTLPYLHQLEEPSISLLDSHKTNTQTGNSMKDGCPQLSSEQSQNSQENDSVHGPELPATLPHGPELPATLPHGPELPDTLPDDPELPATLPDVSSQELVNCIQMINQYIRTSVCTMDFRPFGEYLSRTRINMNVRRVFQPGQTVEDVLSSKRETDNNRDSSLKRQKVGACCL